MKTHILLALVGLATGFVFPTFAQDTVDAKTAQQIRALAAKFNEVFNKHDPAAVAALYTEDAVWETYHGNYRGRQRIEKVYADWCFKRWNKHNWATTISRVTPAGNEVRATGTWSCNITTSTGGAGSDSGRCSWVIVREGDTWKIRKETLTSDAWREGASLSPRRVWCGTPLPLDQAAGSFDTCQSCGHHSAFDPPSNDLRLFWSM